jgi:hypothetical protein
MVRPTEGAIDGVAVTAGCGVEVIGLVTATECAVTSAGVPLVPEQPMSNNSSMPSIRTTRNDSDSARCRARPAINA